MMGEAETKEVQKRYPVKCCVCGYEFSAAKSLMQLGVIMIVAVDHVLSVENF